MPNFLVHLQGQRSLVLVGVVCVSCLLAPAAVLGQDLSNATTTTERSTAIRTVQGEVLPSIPRWTDAEFDDWMARKSAVQKEQIIVPSDPSVDVASLRPTTLPASAPYSVMEAGKGAALDDLELYRVTDLSSIAFSDNRFFSNVNEPSVAINDDAVFVTGNWYAAVSGDNGQNFSYVDPFSTFPDDVGGFCCDQVTIYDDSRDVTFWLMQYIEDGSSNLDRLAFATSKEDMLANTWSYIDITPALLGLDSTGVWLDYPALALSDNYLYFTTNVFTISGSYVTSSIARFPLDDFISGGSVNIQSLSSDEGTIRPVHGATGTMYLGQHRTTASLRLYNWPESEDAPTFLDVAHPGFTFASRTATSITPDGLNWAGRMDSRITAAWLANGVIGFMWSAKEGGSFPQPYVKGIRIEEATQSLINDFEIWNSEFAWLYPSVHPNERGELGGTVSLGGSSIFPSTAAWISEDLDTDVFQSAFFAEGLLGASRWGDYLTVRPHPQAPNTWFGTGYRIEQTAVEDVVVPTYAWFGQVSDDPIPPAPDLAVSNVLLEPAIIEPADTIDFSFQVTNIGDLLAGPHQRAVYLSAVSPFHPDSSWVIATSEQTSVLNPGESVQIEASYIMPDTLAFGFYQVYYVADNMDEVEESNEGNNRANRTVNLVEDAPNDGNDQPTSATALVLPHTENNDYTLDPAELDVDWYQVNLEAGSVYTFAADSPENFDTEFWLYGPGNEEGTEIGPQVGRDDDGGPGLQPLLSYFVEQAGIYYLRVARFDNNPLLDLPYQELKPGSLANAIAGNYSLTITIESGDGNDTPDSATSISIPHTAEYEITSEEDDVDWYIMELSAGVAYEFLATSSGDPEFWLYGPGAADGSDPGPLVANDDDSNGNADPFISYVPESAGFYFLRAAHFGNNPAAQPPDSKNPSAASALLFTYTLIAREAQAPELVTPPDGAVEVALDVTLEWDPPASTPDSYEVEVASGDETLLFRTSAVMDPTTQLLGLETGRTYLWRVRSNTGGTQGSWTPYSSFTTVVSATDQSTDAGLLWGQSADELGGDSLYQFVFGGVAAVLLHDEPAGQVKGIAVHPGQGKIFWSNGVGIYQANIDGTSKALIVDKPESNIVGLAIDAVNDRIYWTDFELDQISSANLDGSEESVVVQGSAPGLTTAADPFGSQPGEVVVQQAVLNNPWGLTVDPVGGYLYWTEQTGNLVGRIKFDGTGEEVLLQETDGLSGPRGIAYDAGDEDALFIVDSFNNRIIRYYFSDGAIQEVLAFADTANPLSLAIDPSTQRVFWSDNTDDGVFSATYAGFERAGLITKILDGGMGPVGLAHVSLIAKDGDDTPLTANEISIPHEGQYSLLPVDTDVDWYRATLDSLQQYRFDITAQEGVASALRLYGPGASSGEDTGPLVMFNEHTDSTQTPFLAFTPSQEGSYFLEISSQENALLKDRAAVDGDYVLNVTAPTTDATVPVIFPEAFCAPGQSIVFPMTVGDLSELGVSGYQSIFSFNSEVVSFSSVNTDGTLSEGRLVEANFENASRGQLAVVGTEAMVGGGTLIELLGSCVGEPDSSTPVQWNEFLFDKSEVGAVLDAGSVSVSSCIPGDANGDLVVDVADAVLILRYIVGTVSEIASCADVTGEGEINVSDAVTLLRYIVGQIECLPVVEGCSVNQEASSDATLVAWGDASKNHEDNTYRVPVQWVNGHSYGFVLTLFLEGLNESDLTITPSLPEGWITAQSIKTGQVRIAATGINTVPTGALADVLIEGFDPANVPALRGILETAEGQRVEFTYNGSEIPDAFSVDPNYPNPFSTITRLIYRLPQEAEVTVALFDVLGRRIQIVESASRPAGQHSVLIDATELPNGMYFYRVQAGEDMAVGQMMVIK